MFLKIKGQIHSEINNLNISQLQQTPYTYLDKEEPFKADLEESRFS